MEGIKQREGKTKIIPYLCSTIIYYFYIVPRVYRICFTEQIGKKEFSAPNSKHINL